MKPLPRRIFMRSFGACIAGVVVPTSTAFATCTDALGRKASPLRALKVVLIDRTTFLGPKTVTEMVAKLSLWPKADERLLILSFGGIDAELLRLEFEHSFEAVALPEKIVREVSTRANLAFAECAKGAHGKAISQLSSVLTAVLSKPQMSAEGYSPILDAVNAVSFAFSDHRSKLKSMMLISDGIENASGSMAAREKSFYLPGGGERVRAINVERTISTLVQDNRLADLTGVNVWHAGFAQPPSNNGVLVRPRSSAEIASLRAFWTQYWQKTKATFVGYGQPLPLQPLTS